MLTFENYTLDHYRQLMSNPKFAAMSTEQKLQILGYAHNQGVGSRRRGTGAMGYLDSGRAGSDAWGTSGTAYFGPIHQRLAEAAAAQASKPIVPPIKPGTGLPEFHPEAKRAYGGMAGAIAAMKEAAQPIPTAYLHAAAVAGGAARIANDNRTISHHDNSSETNVGHITINTNAKDGHAVARDLKQSLADAQRTAGFNSGPR